MNESENTTAQPRDSEGVEAEEELSWSVRGSESEENDDDSKSEEEKGAPEVVAVRKRGDC